MKESEVRPPDLFNQYLELARADADDMLGHRDEFVTVACPACASSSSRSGISKLGFEYLLCADCGSLYNSPRPSEAALERFYAESASVRFWSSDFFRRTAEARREKMFRPRAEFAASLAPVGDGTGQPAVVDVGAGYGIFLEELRRLEHFRRVLAIEPSPALAATCRDRGFEVIESAVELVPAGSVEADLASCFEVIEHAFSPLDFLSAIARLVRPGGAVLFTTLTVSGFDIQLLWERSNSVHPPHHLNLLSTEGMEILVRRAGLELVELSTPGQLDVDIVVNMRSEDPGLPLPRFVEYLLDRRDESARDELQAFLVRHRLSSHLRVVARRPLGPIGR